MPKVFIPNKSSHNFSSAEKFGELVFLTSGSVNRFAVANMMRDLEAALAEAQIDDFIMVTSLAVLTALTCSIMATRFGQVNLLIYDVKDDKYCRRTVVFNKETSNVRAA